MGYRSARCNSLPLFLVTFKQNFQSTTPGREAAKVLITLKQGKRSVIDYAIEFRTIAADSGWNQPALVDASLNGLSETLMAHLAPLGLLVELEALITSASKIDETFSKGQRHGFNKVNSEFFQLPRDVYILQLHLGFQLMVFSLLT